MENILLFSVEINPEELISEKPELSISISSHNYMTEEEIKQTEKALITVSQTVMTALLRAINDSNPQ